MSPRTVLQGRQQKGSEITLMAEVCAFANVLAPLTVADTPRSSVLASTARTMTCSA